jgi:hypothetical protein
MSGGQPTNFSRLILPSSVPPTLPSPPPAFQLSSSHKPRPKTLPHSLRRISFPRCYYGNPHHDAKPITVQHVRISMLGFAMDLLHLHGQSFFAEICRDGTQLPLRDGQRLAEIPGTFPLSSGSSVFSRFPHLRVTPYRHRSPAFRPYIPSNQEYHVQHTSPAVPPLQIRTNHSTSDANYTPL